MPENHRRAPSGLAPARLAFRELGRPESAMRPPPLRTYLLGAAPRTPSTSDLRRGTLPPWSAPSAALAPRGLTKPRASDRPYAPRDLQRTQRSLEGEAWSPGGDSPVSAREMNRGAPRANL